MKITKTQLRQIIQEEINESYADFEAKKLARHFLEVIKGEGAPLKNFKPFLFQQMKDMYTGDYPDVDSQFTIKWNDSRFNIDWPIIDPILQPRDR